MSGHRRTPCGSLSRKNQPRSGSRASNNHAEREIRGFVLWRKVSYGSRSERGDAFAANLKSVVHTCRKQGRAVLPYLTAAIQASLRGKPAPSLVVNP